MRATVRRLQLDLLKMNDRVAELTTEVEEAKAAAIAAAAVAPIPTEATSFEMDDMSVETPPSAFKKASPAPDLDSDDGGGEEAVGHIRESVEHSLAAFRKSQNESFDEFSVTLHPALTLQFYFTHFH
jgi:hypothetical protein